MCGCDVCGSLEGPNLQVLDGEVLFGGQWLIVEGGASGGGAVVEISVQPQPQTLSSSNLKRICVPFYKVGVFPCPAVHLNLGAEAVEEGFSCAIVVFTHSERVCGKHSKNLVVHVFDDHQHRTVQHHQVPVECFQAGAVYDCTIDQTPRITLNTGWQTSGQLLNVCVL